MAAGHVSTPGWPRARLPWRGTGPRSTVTRCPELPDMLPVPWINGPCVEAHGDWHGFREDACRAHYERLCPVCGEPNGVRIILGSYGRARGRPSTSGPGGHPRCMWLAANCCPRLVEEGTIVAYEYIGDGLGYVATEEEIEDEFGGGEVLHEDCTPLSREALRWIAKVDPLGREWREFPQVGASPSARCESCRDLPILRCVACGNRDNFPAGYGAGRYSCTAECTGDRSKLTEHVVEACSRCGIKWSGDREDAA